MEAKTANQIKQKNTHTDTHTKTNTQRHTHKDTATHRQLMSDYHQVDVTFSSSSLAGQNGRLKSQIKTLAKGEGKQISRDTAGDIDWNSDTATATTTATATVRAASLMVICVYRAYAA